MSYRLKSPEASTDPLTVAAVDLGSNSFHMIVVEFQGGRSRVVDRLKESVRLAGGLQADGRLDPVACDRALACLRRFGERLKPLPGAHVRVVGTNTLRQARSIESFLEQAHQALGHPIEIIYGVEEARLIYAGVVEDLNASPGRRLVIDIGGGSTEIVIGNEDVPQLVESVPLGAVTQMSRFFPSEAITKSGWDAAVLDVQVVLEPIVRAYRASGWDIAIGASGSIKSILRAGGLDGPDAEITPPLLKKLGKQVRKAGKLDKLSIGDMADDRRAIFPGGLAVLTGLFEALGITSMRVSDKALREGVIADLIGRLSAHDSRDDGVAAAADTYRVDREHGLQVADTAVRLLASAGLADTAPRQLLRWSAMLHEIGLAIAHRAYHKHGEYLLANADLRGFSQADQRLMATLVRLHRGRLRRELIDAMPGGWGDIGLALAVCLRLAVILHRGRDPQIMPSVALTITDDCVELVFDEGWLDSRPLTRADLDRESERLAQAGLSLKIDTAESGDQAAGS
ncbi:MAG: Ppx/GppA phosphatase family protein [Salinisphaera sp.]|jgi:exopolyphosphatase/guanosine-5'-triphosphate,3'-diphosphate pyrophosphatase|nr:Ppx/GppA phosphatase family protein [Salinisphaera sp.]